MRLIRDSQIIKVNKLGNCSTVSASRWKLHKNENLVLWYCLINSKDNLPAVLFKHYYQVMDCQLQVKTFINLNITNKKRT